MWELMLGGGIDRVIERAAMVLVVSTCAGTGGWGLAAVVLGVVTWRRPQPWLRGASALHGAVILLASAMPALAVAVLASPRQSLGVWAVVALVSAPLAIGGIVDLLVAARSSRAQDAAAPDEHGQRRDELGDGYRR